jgi:hypothetical protein
LMPLALAASSVSADWAPPMPTGLRYRIQRRWCCHRGNDIQRAPVA